MSLNNNISLDNELINRLQTDAIDLLKSLIAIPSFSKEEDKTAAILIDFFAARKIKTERLINNIWATNLHFDSNKPSLLLNSHHDTVKPNKGYTIDPFDPFEKEGKLFGLGSNDAGGCLVSLLATFLYFYEKENLPYNIILLHPQRKKFRDMMVLNWFYPNCRKLNLEL